VRAGQQMTQWYVSEWFNTAQPVQPADLRGRVVMIHAFQMLCPGCVSHGIPQAVRVRQALPEKDLAVIGLHTVFENHAAMQPHALAAFIREYRLQFPIAVDEASGSSAIPKTMQLLRLQGTPSVVLLDREGRLRLNHFGLLDDLRLGTMLGQLLAESSAQLSSAPASPAAAGCTVDACLVRTE
jgi:hypothetical protein